MFLSAVITDPCLAILQDTELRRDPRKDQDKEPESCREPSEDIEHYLGVYLDIETEQCQENSYDEDA